MRLTSATDVLREFKEGSALRHTLDIAPHPANAIPVPPHSIWHHPSVAGDAKAFFILMLDFTRFCAGLRSAGGRCRSLPTCGCR
jgi:hypothetical protein